MIKTRDRNPFATRLGGALVLLSGFFFAVSGAAQDGLMQGFELVDDQQLLVEGVADPKAQIYVQRRLAAYLVLPSGKNQGIVLLARSRAARTANLMKMHTGPGGLIDLQPDALYGPAAAFEIDASGVQFALEGVKYKLVERPVLLGLMAAKGLEDYSRIYIDRAKEYALEAAALATLMKTARKVHVRVYFGSWCPHCQVYVPRVVRMANELAGSNVKIDFYGLPRGIVGDPVARQADIASVPTAVIFIDGKEAGRWDAADWEKPENALLRLIGSTS